MRRFVAEKKRLVKSVFISIAVILIANIPYGVQGAPVYDLDGSGVVDEGDANVIKAAFGKCQGNQGYDARADYDGDNCITFVDYQQWYAAYKGQ